MLRDASQWLPVFDNGVFGLARSTVFFQWLFGWRRPCALVMAFVLAFFTLPGHAAPIDELKAAYLLNFARLTAWPEDRFVSPQAPLVFCGLSMDPVAIALKELSDDRRIGDRPVRFRYISSASDRQWCHVLYLGNGLPVRQRAPYLTPQRGLLLVGDNADFLALGGVISYFVQGTKLRFEVNEAQARSVDLVISARLLNLAKRREEQL